MRVRISAGSGYNQHFRVAMWPKAGRVVTVDPSARRDTIPDPDDEGHSTPVTLTVASYEYVRAATSTGRVVVEPIDQPDGVSAEMALALERAGVVIEQLRAERNRAVEERRALAEHFDEERHRAEGLQSRLAGAEARVLELEATEQRRATSAQDAIAAAAAARQALDEERAKVADVLERLAVAEARVSELEGAAPKKREKASPDAQKG